MIFREIFTNDGLIWVYHIKMGDPGHPNTADLIGEGRCASEEAAYIQSRGILREYHRLGDDVADLSDPYLHQEALLGRVIEVQSFFDSARPRNWKAIPYKMLVKMIAPDELEQAVKDLLAGQTIPSALATMHLRLQPKTKGDINQ